MKKFVALILALIMCLSLVACGSEKPAESKAPSTGEGGKAFSDYTLEDWEAHADHLEANGEGKDYKILYLVSWAASEYFVSSYDVWKDQFAKMGWELDMQGPKEYTTDSQLAALESALISQQYDAIILYPINGEAFVGPYPELWETYETPIIIWGLPVTEPQYGNYYIMNGDRYVITGDYMVDMILDYVNANEEYFSKYKETGIPTSIFASAINPVQNVRMLRILELLEADGRFDIVEYYENVTDDKVQQYGESLLLNHPEVEILAVYNDVHAMILDTVFKDASVELSDHLKVISSDGNQAALRLLVEEGADSTLYGTAMSNHEFIGELMIENIRLIVPAAEAGIEEIPGLTDRNVVDFLAGENTIKVTAENAALYKWD